MTKRNERRSTNPERKTYSMYLHRGVVEALDGLVSVGEYANRSDAIEEACKKLIKSSAIERINAIDEAVAA